MSKAARAKDDSEKQGRAAQQQPAEEEEEERAQPAQPAQRQKKPKPPADESDSGKWVQWIDSASNKPFWQHTASGETTWRNPHKPAAPAVEKTATLALSQSAQQVVASGSEHTGRTSESGSQMMQQIMNAAYAGGAQFTYVAPGAYAAGCTVNMNYGAHDPSHDHGNGHGRGSLRGNEYPATGGSGGMHQMAPPGGMHQQGPPPSARHGYF